MRKRIAMFCCALLLVALPLAADDWNKKTIVTFSQPVELPGVVLPAGTYVFKLLDSLSTRNIVQVFNAEENKLFTTILAIPNYRLNPSGETVLRFDERPRTMPEALRAWFYPGDNFGQEFVYPRYRATALSGSTGQPVLAGDVKPADTPEEMTKVEVATIAPPVVTPPVPETPPAVAIEPSAPIPAWVEAPATHVEELPGTAGALPLLLLAGVSSLGIARLIKAHN